MRNKLSKMWLPLGPVLAAAIVCMAPATFVAAQDTNAPVAATAPKADAAPPAQKVEKKKKLTGAELYEINCNRCHAERYATEFTSAQWKTITMHMRVRANIPAAQVREILKFLQEDSGN